MASAAPAARGRRRVRARHDVARLVRYARRHDDPHLRCPGAARRVPGPPTRGARWPARRLPRRPRWHPGPPARHRRGHRLLHEPQRQRGRRVHHQRAQRRDDRRGARGRGRLPGRGQPRGDQVRLQHVDAHPAHRAEHRRDPPAGRRDRGHDPGPRGQRQHLGGDGRRSRRDRAQGRCPRGRPDPRPGGPREQAQRAHQARRRGPGQQRGRDHQPGRATSSSGPTRSAR